MKSTLITLGFLLATSQAAQRTLKNLLESENISENPLDYGFAPNCTYNFPSLPTGSAPGTGAPAVCSCSVSGTTGAGLPALGQATYTTNNNALNAATTEALSSVPDT